MGGFHSTNRDQGDQRDNRNKDKDRNTLPQFHAYGCNYFGRNTPIARKKSLQQKPNQSRLPRRASPYASHVPKWTPDLGCKSNETFTVEHKHRDISRPYIASRSQNAPVSRRISNRTVVIPPDRVKRLPVARPNIRVSPGYRHHSHSRVYHHRVATPHARIAVKHRPFIHPNVGINTDLVVTPLRTPLRTCPSNHVSKAPVSPPKAKKSAKPSGPPCTKSASRRYRRGIKSKD